MRHAFCLLLAVCLAGPLLAESAPHKNVVVMVTDDQGLDAGCYGNPVIQTPNLDHLAAEGTRFEFGFCTTSSCSASRSVILTGLYNHANGQYGHLHGYNHFNSHEWVQSLPVLLSRAGYRTCRIGKYHVGPESVYQFDDAAEKGPRGTPRGPVQMAERAEEFIRANGDRPFFLYFCTTEPHRASKGFGNDSPHPGVNAVKYDPKDIPVPPFLPDKPEVRQELAEYYQAVSRADQGLGRLVQALKNTGHWDDTVLFYLSDNGIPFPGAKTTVYEPGIHLPLVVRSPQQAKRGVVTKAMATWADITPTILDYTGAKGPDYPLHGRSFISVLEEPDPPGWDEIYASHTFHEITMYYPMRVIRTRRYKLILNLAHELPYPFASDLYGSLTWQGVLKRGDKIYGRRTVDAYVHRPRYELYDLQADPDELVNLADRPEHQQTLAELGGKLRNWQEKTKDPWVIKYQHE